MSKVMDRLSSLPNFCRCALMISSLVACAWSAQALPRTWNGNSGPLWNVAINWTPAGVPANGDDLIFPAGASNPVNTNDLVGRTFSSISFNGAAGGYALRGNAITLNAGIVAAHTAGDNAVDLPITLGANQTFTVTSGGTLDVNANINLNSFNLTNALDFACRLDGRISGAGQLIKIGSGGPLAIGGTLANTFTGPTVVVGGTVTLNKTAGVTAIPDDLLIGNGGAILDIVRLLTANQIADTADVIMDDSGVLDLNNLNDGIATLTMTGGTVNTGTGTLTNGNITTLASAETAIINGNLHIGNATRTFNVGGGTAAIDLDINANISGGVGVGITKIGPGTLALGGNNTYTGATTVNDGEVSVDSNTGFGSGTAGVTANSNSVLRLVGADIGNKPLVFNGSRAPAANLLGAGSCGWTGAITLNTNVIISAGSGGTLNLFGAISGVGGITFNGLGTNLISGTNVNTYAGDTILTDGALLLNKNANNGAIPGDLIIGNGIGGQIVQLRDDDQIANGAIVTVDNAVLDLNGFGDIIGNLIMTRATAQNGRLRLNGNVTVNAAATASTISGSLELFSSPIRSFTVADGAASPDLLVSANVVGVGGINKLGPGLMSLTASNEHTRSNIISAGTLVINHDHALGAVSNGTIVASGAALAIDVAVDDLREPLTIAGSGTANNGALQLLLGGVIINTNVVLSAAATINTAGASMNIIGVISGTGPLTKIGTGNLVFSGGSANSYSGNTLINAGTLQMNKTLGNAVPSALIIGDGTSAATARNFNDAQVDNVTVNQGSLWDLNGFNDTISQLILNEGGDVSTGAGVLTFNGASATDINVNGPFPLLDSSTIGGNIGINGVVTIDTEDGAGFFGDGAELSSSAVISGSGSIVKTGPGDLFLSGANTYTGATSVNDGELRIGSGTALGGVGNGTTLNNDAVLSLYNSISVGLEGLTNNSAGEGGLGAVNNQAGSNFWAGPVHMLTNTTVNVETNTTLNLAGAISAAASEDLTKIGPGILIFSGNRSNTYHITRVNAGTLLLAKTIPNAAIPDDLLIGDELGGLEADVVRVVGTNQINDRCEMSIRSSGLLDLNGVAETIGELTGIGRIDVSGGTLDVGTGTDSFTFDGLIYGTGNIMKTGTGTWTLTANNTYTGTSTVSNGTLRVNGFQPQSHVTILVPGTLAGDGTVGHITASGNIAPGASPAILTCSNVAFNSFGDFSVELNDLAPDSGYDQLNVRGTVNLGAAMLHVTLGPDFAPLDGQRFTIITNDGIDAVTGTFAGLANGSVFTVGPRQFRIVYNSGSGNDVQLIVTNIPVRFFLYQTASGGNGNNEVDPNECNNLFIIALTNLFGAPVTGISATLVSQTPGLAVTQPFSAYTDIPTDGRGTNRTPFQISTMPGFVCGTNLTLELIVTSVSHGNFRVPVTLSLSGSAGPARRFDNSAATAIPDLGMVESSIIVSGIDTPLRVVTLSLHITHTAVDDLDISLISPSGTAIVLSSDNGGTASDYGTGCADGQRTLFSGGAATPITSGSAPFVGAFRPEGSLGVYFGDLPPDVNGTWRLRIADDTGGALGTLRCWSLFLSPTVCTDGRGACESCPERTIYGFVNQGDQTQEARLFRDANPSVCATAKPCPGPFGSGPRHYDAYTFENGESNACITVTLLADCALFSAAYTNSFNPTNLCENYMADLGDNTFDATNYSFQVGPGARFVVVVHEFSVNAGCAYTLRVSGGSCRPILNIEPIAGDRVVLDWTTAAVGYLLERTNLLGNPTSPVWLPAMPLPTIFDSRFRVTNNITGSQNFYRLRRP